MEEEEGSAFAAYLAMLLWITGVVFGTSDRPEEMVVYDARRRCQTVDGCEMRGASAPQTTASSCLAAAATTAASCWAASYVLETYADAAAPAARALVLLLVVVVLLAAGEVFPNRRRARRVRAARYELGARSYHALKYKQLLLPSCSNFYSQYIIYNIHFCEYNIYTSNFWCDMGTNKLSNNTHRIFTLLLPSRS